MNANAFRHFFEYHFSENRKLWDMYIVPLTQEKFIKNIDYSQGSVRDQIVHLMDVDEAWFCELQGVEPSESLTSVNFDDRRIIRDHWDRIEIVMRDYLTGLQDDMLFDKPIKEPEEDKELIVWQVLLHVANHGTDHRAQLLRVLNDMGAKTSSQDYIFYVYDNP